MMIIMMMMMMMMMIMVILIMMIVVMIVMILIIMIMITMMMIKMSVPASTVIVIQQNITVATANEPILHINALMMCNCSSIIPSTALTMDPVGPLNASPGAYILQILAHNTQCIEVAVRTATEIQ